MNRAEFIKDVVLSTICDDYENIDQTILREVNRHAAEAGLTVSRDEVVSALTGLISDGLAKAYSLSSAQPYAVQLAVMPAAESVGTEFRLYFHATKKGIEMQSRE